MSKIRLDRFISNQTPLSRSEAVRAVRRGEVSVDGVIIKQPSFLICAEKEKVALWGNSVQYKRHIYIIMNKPKGVICATRDKSAKTVIDLLPEEMKRKDLAAVGRLDKDTTGLLILTDDGDFAHRCISPKKMVPKTYEAVLDRDINDGDITAFAEGITLKDGAKLMPSTLKRTAPNTALVTVFEGKYHQIKRMFGVLGAGVNELKRLSVGSLILPKDLLPGEAIEINYNELAEKTINYKQNTP